jgi:hypothetical protein
MNLIWIRVDALMQHRLEQRHDSLKRLKVLGEDTGVPTIKSQNVLIYQCHMADSGSAILFFTRSPLQVAGGSSVEKLELPTQALRPDRSMDPQADLGSRKN